MEIVRLIARSSPGESGSRVPGESLIDIIEEVKRLTFSTDCEHALVKLATGETAIVRGDRDGVEFSTDEVVRIFGHSHPYSAPATGCASTEDREALKALGQQSSYILERGVIFRYGTE